MTRSSEELNLFDCPRHATLRLLPATCSRMWQRALRLPTNSLETVAKCKGCPIGAKHSGCENVVPEPHRPTRNCTRCGKHAFKLIFGCICVSCRNRELELASGFNARGTKPLKIMAVQWRPRVCVNAQGFSRVEIGRTVDDAERMLSIERITDGPLRIGYAYPIIGISRV